MTGSFSVKIKSKKGQFIVNDLGEQTTLADLRKRIEQVTQIRETNLYVLIGYPPRPLDLFNNAQRNLRAAGIHSGETLIVEEKQINNDSGSSISGNSNNRYLEPQPRQRHTIEDDEALARRLQAEEEAEHLREVAELEEAAAIAAAAENDEQLLPETRATSTSAGLSDGYSNVENVGVGIGTNGDFNGILLKKVVPADNSCLFTSIRFVLNGKVDNEGSEMMRHIIATEVAADPQQYNDAILGKSNSEYCEWIQRPDSWGGAIEVAILSNYYGIEIDVVDIQNAIINRFGEDKNYGLRVFLLFDGIHYDPLYMETMHGPAPATIFPVEEMSVYEQAEQLANEAKSSRQFTNVDKFTLRCRQCDVMLIGQTQAQHHAKSTGHTEFGEI